jgi:cell wall-associated NlpC family hydrolase
MTNPPRSTFSLSGPSIALDPRVHALRGDLADIALAGQLFAPHYARPMQMQCVVISTMIRGTPTSDDKAISQLLFGEDFMVVDMSGGWAWGYCRNDHYVGYVPAASLAPPASGVSGMVTVRSALLFSAPDPSSNVTGTLPMGAVAVGKRDGSYVETSLGFVHEDALNGHYVDHVAVAETLVDTPYVWGGRAGDGIDCSGLVQLSLAVTGQSAPRDSDQQQDQLGTDIPDASPLKRGDIIFFPGHVGMMVDAQTFIHATMHYGKTVIEPLADVVARTALEHEMPILARKRL